MPTSKIGWEGYLIKNQMGTELYLVDIAYILNNSLPVCCDKTQFTLM